MFWRLVCEFGIALDMLQVVRDILGKRLQSWMDWSRMQGPEILRFSSALFSRALVPAGAKCYHIYSSRATIFYFLDTVHFSARSLTYEMLRWAVLTDHYFIRGLLYSPMSRLSLRTLRFEDWCSHLVIYRAVIDAQIYISTFSLDRWWFRWIICMIMTQLVLYCVMVIIDLIIIFMTCINM